jgi:protein-disulfide isomerase
MTPRKAVSRTKKARKAPAKKSAKTRAKKAESKKHISPWWVFWTYLFGALFIIAVTAAGYALNNPGVLGTLDGYFGASILEDNAEDFCQDLYFEAQESREGLFEVDGYVCQKGVIVPIEIVYDSECPECLSPAIENTLKLAMPTSVITKRDIRAEGSGGIVFNSLPYAVIGSEIESTEAMAAFANKMSKVGDVYVMNTSAITNAPRSVVMDIEKDNIPSKGVDSADIKIIEYTGTQCPSCKNFLDGVWDKIIDEYVETEHAQYFSKIIPVGDDEEMANKSANAMMCANDQGKYFEYLKEVLSIEDEVDEEKLLIAADQVGLGPAEFEHCIEEKRFDEVAKNNASDIQKLGISTVPTYVIGNKIYAGPLTYNAISTIIGNELIRHGVLQEGLEENMQDEPSWGTGDLEINVYSDFVCVQCAIDWRMLREATIGLEDKVKIIFTNYPNERNAYGEAAANAGECAAAEGDFWNFMELMFSNQSDLRTTTLERYGLQVGFGGSFQACVRGNVYLPEVEHDIVQAELADVSNTPTYFIGGGELLNVPDSVDGWRELIEQRL